ncbi:MAG: phosphatase [bacterium]
MNNRKIKLIADFHLHTVASGHAYSTVEEYAAAAKKKDLKVIAITDHGPAMPGGAFPYHFSNQRMIPDSLNGVRILRGGEINIVDPQGHLDLPDELLKTLDFTSIAMHPKCGYEGNGEEENTKALLNAMENQYVRVIAHPGNPMYPIDYRKVIPIAKEKGILIELNNSSLTISRKGSFDRCFAIAKFVKQIGWKVVLGSDAHISTMVGELDAVLRMAKDAGLGKDDIINTSMDLIDKYLLRK